MPDADKASPFAHKATTMLVSFAAVLLGGFLIQHFLIGMYTVSTGSMEPSYHGCQTNENGKCTRLFVFKGGKNPKPGDVIVFTPPNERWGSDGVLAKRVIATAGQRVSCDNDHGLTGLLVDGERASEPYLDREWLLEKYGDKLAMSNGKIAPCYGPEWSAVVVPEGYVFVLGDNRGDSKDSRAFVKGDSPDDFGYAVPLSHVKGTVIYSWG